MGLKHWLRSGGSLGPHKSESKSSPTSLFSFTSMSDVASWPVNRWSCCMTILTSSLCDCEALRVAVLNGKVRMKSPTLSGGIRCPLSAVFSMEVLTGLWFPLWNNNSVCLLHCLTEYTNVFVLMLHFLPIGLVPTIFIKQTNNLLSSQFLVVIFV